MADMASPPLDVVDEWEFFMAQHGDDFLANLTPEDVGGANFDRQFDNDLFGDNLPGDLALPDNSSEETSLPQEDDSASVEANDDDGEELYQDVIGMCEDNISPDELSGDNLYEQLNVLPRYLTLPDHSEGTFLSEEDGPYVEDDGFLIEADDDDNAGMLPGAMQASPAPAATSLKRKADDSEPHHQPSPKKARGGLALPTGRGGLALPTLKKTAVEKAVACEVAPQQLPNTASSPSNGSDSVGPASRAPFPPSDTTVEAEKTKKKKAAKGKAKVTGRDQEEVLSRPVRRFAVPAHVDVPGRVNAFNRGRAGTLAFSANKNFLIFQARTSDMKMKIPLRLVDTCYPDRKKQNDTVAIKLEDLDTPINIRFCNDQGLAKHHLETFRDAMQMVKLVNKDPEEGAYEDEEGDKEMVVAIDLTNDDDENCEEAVSAESSQSLTPPHSSSSSSGEMTATEPSDDDEVIFQGERERDEIVYMGEHLKVQPPAQTVIERKVAQKRLVWHSLLVARLGLKR